MRAVLTDIRFLPAIVAGLVISFGLFLLMHELISTQQQSASATQPLRLVNFVQVQKSMEVQTKNYNMPKPPPPPKNPPPRQQIETSQSVGVQQQRLPVNVQFNPNSLGVGPGVAINAAPPTNAGGYAPLTPEFRIKPLYPPEAAYEGITGDVNTCFTVNPDGSVSNPRVTGASNPQARQALGQAALRTILQWKFFPQKVNGKPIATNNVCQSIKFTLGQNAGGG